MSRNDLVEISVYVHNETASAVGVSESEDPLVELIWIPRGQIGNALPYGSYRLGEEIELEVPEWLASNEGLI